MINSDDNESLVAGYHFRWPLNEWFTPGMRLGIGTGYDNGISGTGVSLVLVFSAFFHSNGRGVELNLFPNPSGGFVSAGFRFEF